MPTTGTARARESTGQATVSSDHVEISGRNTKRLSFFVLAIAICVATVAIMQSGRHNDFQNVNENASQAASAAFRDGLYLGTLAAEHGAARHMATGRWGRPEDRALFVTGYQTGYSQSLAITQTAPAR
jgi:hypothetical protein